MYIKNDVLYWIFLMKAVISYATGHFSFLPKSPLFTGNRKCVFGSAKYPDMPPDIPNTQLPRQRKFAAQDIYISPLAIKSAIYRLRGIKGRIISLPERCQGNISARLPNGAVTASVVVSLVERRLLVAIISTMDILVSWVSQQSVLPL